MTIHPPVRSGRVKLVPLEPARSNGVSTPTPVTDVMRIPRFDRPNEVSTPTPVTDVVRIPRFDRPNGVSIPTSMTDVMHIPPCIFLALIGKRVVHPGGRPSTEELYRMAQFQAGQRVLEVGCGVGTTAIEIASRFHCQVTAIDVDSLMLDRARINVHDAGLDGKVIVQRADVQELPFSDQEFDCIVIESVLVFVDRVRAVKEILRVCQNGGRVVDHEFMWEDDPPAEVLHTFEETISPNSHFGNWSDFYKAAGLSHIEMASGVSDSLTPAGLIRDEGLKSTLAMAGRTLSNRSYRQKMLKLMQKMSDMSPYLHWAVVGGMKANSAQERTFINSSTGRLQDLNW